MKRLMPLAVLCLSTLAHAGTPGNIDANRLLNRVNVAYATAQTNDRPMQIDIDASGGARQCDTSITDTSDARACPVDPEAPVVDTPAEAA